jgi:hypothetical protein
MCDARDAEAGVTVTVPWEGDADLQTVVAGGGRRDDAVMGRALLPHR